MVAFSTDSHDDLLDLLDECERLGIRAMVVPRLFERVPSRLQVTHVGGLPLLELLPTSPHSIQFAIKYAVDRIAALSLLVLLLSPLLLVLSIAVALSLGRPILYRQDRVEPRRRRFNMLKFRTMLQAPEDEARRSASTRRPPRRRRGSRSPDARRHLPPQVVARRAAAARQRPEGRDEPRRPAAGAPGYVEYFREHVRRYDGRLRTKAGITGWAQIHRLRGQTSISDRVEWDNYYIENFSLWLDFKILLRTIPEALKGRAD